MRKRGAVSVDVGEVCVRFPEEKVQREPPSIWEMAQQAPSVPEDTEVHDSPEAAEAAEAEGPEGPLSGALAAPLQAHLEDDRAPDPDTESFDTWYTTQPKPTSFSR